MPYFDVLLIENGKIKDKYVFQLTVYGIYVFIYRLLFM
jgi:hypothetical protein